MTSLLKKAEVAKALGISPHTLDKNIVALRRDKGFPQPVPGMGGRYDPIAIEAWRKRLAGVLPTDAAPANEPANDDVVRWQAELDRRSAELAG